jgi:hypothetical protein
MLIKRIMLISATVLGLSVCGQAVSVVCGNPAVSDIYVTPNPTSTFTLVRGGFGGHGGFGGGMGGRGFAMGGMGARGFAMGGRGFAMRGLGGHGFAMGGLGRPSAAMGAPRSVAASGPRGTLFAAAGVSGFHLQNGRFIQGRFIHGRFFPGRFVGNRRFFPRIGVGLGWGSTCYGYGEGGSCF